MFPLRSIRDWCGAWTTTTEPFLNGSVKNWVPREPFVGEDGTTRFLKCSAAPLPLRAVLPWGVERLIELLKAKGDTDTSKKADVFIAHQGEDALLEATVLAESLRNTGLDVTLYCRPVNSGGSFKAQMKRADESGAAFAVLIGEDEIGSGCASVKALRSENTGNNQTSVPFEKVADYLIDQIVGECGCGENPASHNSCIH